MQMMKETRRQNAVKDVCFFPTHHCNSVSLQEASLAQIRVRSPTTHLMWDDSSELREEGWWMIEKNIKNGYWVPLWTQSQHGQKQNKFIHIPILSWAASAYIWDHFCAFHGYLVCHFAEILGLHLIILVAKCSCFVFVFPFFFFFIYFLTNCFLSFPLQAELAGMNAELAHLGVKEWFCRLLLAADMLSLLALGNFPNFSAGSVDWLWDGISLSRCHRAAPLGGMRVQP